MIRKKKFNCTQQELYTVCASGWESCRQNLEKFASFKPKYTVAYVDAKLAAVREASRLLNRYQHLAAQKLIRLNLKAQVDVCLSAWKKLKSVIEEVWPALEHEARLEEAGYHFYKDSYNQKWEACIGLMDAAETFVKAHQDQLLANDNLEPAYAENFSSLVKSFHEQFQKFRDSIKHTEEGADSKLEINNAIYTAFKTLSTDAKMIFRNDPVKLKQFVFESMLNTLSGPGTAGIKGSVSNGQMPIEDIDAVGLSLAETGETIEVRDDGSYRFTRLASGSYTVKVSAPGYKDQIIPNVTVSSGTYTTLNVLLEKLAA